MANSEMNKVTLLQKKLLYSTLRDGLRELFQALLMFLCILMFINLYTQFIFGIIVILLAILWPKFYKYIKMEFIYPRIGFIDFLPNHQSKMKRYRTTTAIIIILSFVSFFLIVILQDWTINNTMKYLPIFVGGVIFARSLYYYILTGQWQYTLLGFVCWLSAFGLYLLNIAEGRFYPMIYCSFQSLLYFLIGSWKYHHFIKNNPKLADQEIA